MIILERSVTKYYSTKFYRVLYRKLQKGEYEQVGTSGILRVHGNRHERFYVKAIEHNGHLRPAAWLYLWQRTDWKAWEVLQIFAFEFFRGNGIAKKLYQAAINLDKILLASGKTHTRWSKRLWEKFVANKTFEVFAIDFKDLSRRSQVFMDDGELWCSLDIYTDSETTEDVRLVALKRS